MDVWVDDTGFVRRVTTEVNAGVDAGVVTVTVDYTEPGEPQRIEVPSAEDVTDITPMVNGVLTGPFSGN